MMTRTTNKCTRSSPPVAAGERLRPLTNDRPKCMVEIAGRPILEYQLAGLRRHGVLDVTISCGYLAEVIQSQIGDGSRPGIHASYAIEEQPLGRGGSGFGMRWRH